MLWVLLPLLLASAARPCAGQTVPADSAGRRTVQLGETRVDTVRYPAPGVSSFSPPRDLPPPGAYTTDLDAAALRSLGAGASLGAVLAQRTPLVVRQYGPGQLASLSVRGTTAQHVAVMWQGFNINFPTLGQADMSLLPAAALTGVSLLHGPDAARVGSGAVGGALTLATSAAPSAPGSANAEAALSGGSFGQRAANARVSASYQRHGFSTSGQAGQATNDFPYRVRTFRGWQPARLVNAETRAYSLTHTHWLDLDAPGHWRLTAAAWLTGADRQLAPPLNTPNTHAHEHDASQRVALDLAYRYRTTLRVASLTDVINYRDDLTGTSDSRSQSWQAQAAHLQRLGRRFEARGGAEAQHFRARADGYGAGLKTENRAAAFGTLDWVADGARASLTVRQAMVPGARVPLMPAVGAEWTVPKTRLRLNAGAARAYRAPTLNERYWRVGGNPALRPETSTSYHAGLAASTTDGPETLPSAANRSRFGLSARVAVFDQRVADWVQWTPDPTTGRWSPRNLRRVRSRGVEGDIVVWHHAKLLVNGRAGETTLRLAGQLLQTRKTAGAPADADPLGIQLPYVPARTGSATLTHEYAMRRASLGLDFTGTLTSLRTTNASGTEALPAYGLLNAGLWGEWVAGQARLRLRFDGFNLLGTEYQSITNRPMPGRSWQATLGVRYN